MGLKIVLCIPHVRNRARSSQNFEAENTPTDDIPGEHVLGRVEGSGLQEEEKERDVYG